MAEQELDATLGLEGEPEVERQSRTLLGVEHFSLRGNTTGGDANGDCGSSKPELLNGLLLMTELRERGDELAPPPIVSACSS